MRLVGQSLALRSEAFVALDTGVAGLRFALAVVFLAGLSAAVGQSVVLFANRVRPRRFVASLLLSGGLFVLVYVLWATTLWLASGWLFDRPRPYLAALRTVGLAYSPQLFGFLTLTPYFGSAIAAALSVWNLLAITVAARVIFDLGSGQAVAAAALGWVLMQVLQRTIGRPVLRATRALRAAVAGRSLAPLADAVRDAGRERP